MFYDNINVNVNVTKPSLYLPKIKSRTNVRTVMKTEANADP